MKLTKETKNVVLQAATKKVFDARFEAIEKKIGEEVVQVLLNRGKKLGKEIPDGWNEYVAEQKSATIKYRTINDWNCRINVNLPVSFCSKRFTYNDLELKEEEIPSFCEYKKAEDERDRFVESASLVLKVINTDKELKEAAPELYEFLPVKAVDKNLPMSNKDIDLVRSVLGGVK